MPRSPVIRIATAALVIAPAAAHASFLSGDALDSAANFMSWFVLIVMPIVAIGLFLFVHVLPEKIAEKRHHPQKDSIKVLCILSLFFGGLLWPLAWLWAYTKPVMAKAVYGTEKHDDYFIEMGEKARNGTLTVDELADLRHELAGMAERGTLAPALRRLREDLVAIEHAAVALKVKEKV
jgi:CBS domain containing-hemolysin-like protein